MADSGDLMLDGDHFAASANIMLNAVTAGVALMGRMQAEKVVGK